MLEVLLHASNAAVWHLWRSGHGFGVKIVGGKIISDKSNEVGAFVTAIQRGGIADQLHGELQEGIIIYIIITVAFHLCTLYIQLYL